uniref:Transcription factor 7 n=1 Tax=Panthera leo TaxID=9689 RepID=A0A8C8WCI7_PANLE
MFGPASSRSRSAWRPRPAPAARPGGVSPRSARRASGSEVPTPGSPPAGPAPRPALPRPAPPRAERTMPQLDSGGGGAGGGDDLGAPDELLAFQDEGEEQDDKSRDSAAGPERDLAELKSSLVNESEGAAGGAGVPGAGAGARGEAEVGAEVSAGPRPAPLARQPPPVPCWPRPALPVPWGTHPSDPSCPGPRAPRPSRPSRPLWISPQALGREHASQRLFPDKLPESLEDGLKAPECASGMYKDTVYSAFNLLMHYPPPSGAGQHPQPQPPLHNKASQPAHSVPQLSPLYEHFSSPHPTPAPADISQKQGVHRPLQTPDLSGFYSLTSGSMGQLPHTVSWFTHPSLMLGSGVPGHPAAIPHPAIVPPSGKQELQPYDRSLKTQAESKAEKEAKKPTIKKPLNAFMLYMKEMRAKVIAECTLKESAAINQILGRRWHALSREEQAKYYELARKERQLHMQLYPGWSARDNYGKKKRRSREKHQESNTGGKRNAFELLASPAEPAPTSPGLSAALSLPAPWTPTDPPQRPAEYTAATTGISETGSLACTGHVAATRGSSSERKRQSPKARGNWPEALLPPSQGPGPGDFRGCTTSA